MALSIKGLRCKPFSYVTQSVWSIDRNVVVSNKVVPLRGIQNSKFKIQNAFGARV
jgi:hypothetical protein